MAAARNLEEETIVALATPVGNAALAVVRVSGPLAAVLAAEGPLGARRLSPRRVEHRDYHALDGRLVDDVVAVHFPAPRSYTGEDVLEISTHGNPFLVQRVIDDLCARGCRPARPGEFTQRAFLSGRMDLSQAEAVMDVIRARSDRSLELAQRQLRGEMGRRLAPLEEGLLQALAEVEAYIDFPEEDLPAEDRRRVVGRLEAVQTGVRELLATRRVGEWVREGIRTVIVGRPNAGKSSLLNRLVGYERALVSPEPGTTRDFLEEWVRVGPHVLRLVDTAGLNPLAKNELEERGIALGERRAADADLVVWVVDLSDPSPPLPPAAAASWDPARTLIVGNKCDLVVPENAALVLQRAAAALAAARGVGDWPTAMVSAVSGAGLDSLHTRIEQLADGWQRAAGAEGVAVSARHEQSLVKAEQLVGQALARVDASGSATPAMELLASDVRGALESLGEILGKYDPERMLDHLFATFCIGK
ncbi:MAG: tRNA uridine-5-carboxymethylaminomethyl(34) synthesis GTPase MnmE [Opitutaceae bacterium]